MTLGFLSLSHVRPGRHRRESLRRLLCLGLCLCLAVLLPVDVLAKRKSSRTPRAEPDLKIVDLSVEPTPFEPGSGDLKFSVTVKLPKELNGSTVLEVTSLISSPSKTSLRFLSARQPVQNKDKHPSTMSVLLAWDGKDQRKLLAGSGTYSYEVRTKLLINGDKGLRTMIVSWPKRGTIELK